MKKALIVVALIGTPAFADQSITIPGDPDHEQRIDQIRSDVEALKLRVGELEEGLPASDEPDTGEGDTTDPPAPDDPDTGTVDPTPSTLDELAACDPDVIYSGGSLNAAIDAVGDSGTLGFTEDVKFTDKAEARIYSQGTTGVLRICGLEKADGSKPVITAPIGTPWVFGGFHDLVIDGIELHGIGVTLSGVGGGVSFHELRFDRLDFGQTGGRALFSSYGPSAIGSTVDKPGGTGDDPAETSYITITNTSMRDATGPGNFTHSMYLSRRGCVFRADNVSVEAIDGLEAFRSLCRVNVVTDSYFTNVVREADGTLRRAREGRQDEYGATPLDTPSCGAYILRGNEFDIHSDGGTVAAIGLRLRLSMTGCDMPNNWHLENLTTRVPWPEVSPEVGNPHLFPVIVEGNTFRFHGTSGNERIVSGWGTYPRRHQQDGGSSANVDYLVAPDTWRERNAVFWKDNLIEGDWAFVHRLDLRQRRSDTSDPAAWQPGEIPPVPFVETTEALPQTCDDLSYLQWWDEPGDHTGFPACP